MAEVKKEAPSLVEIDETKQTRELNGNLVVADKSISPEKLDEYLKMTDSWALFGYGMDYPPVGGLPKEMTHADPALAALSLADRCVPEMVRGKTKRHLLDPAEFGLTLDYEKSGVDRLLLIEYPVDQEGDLKPAERHMMFGSARIDGGWCVLWHNTQTGEDKYIHCPTCIETVATFLLLAQKAWNDGASHRKTLN